MFPVRNISVFLWGTQGRGGLCGNTGKREKSRLMENDLHQGIFHGKNLSLPPVLVFLILKSFES